MFIDPELDPYRPSRKFSAPLSLDDHAGEETKEKQRLRHERLMTVGEEVLDEIQLEKKKALMKTMDDSKGREQRYENVLHVVTYIATTFVKVMPIILIVRCYNNYILIIFICTYICNTDAVQ